METKETIKLIDYLIGMVGDDTDNDYDEAFRMAISSLNKSEPQHQKYQDVCPKCYSHNPTWEKLANPKGHPVVYCWNCGQAVYREVVGE